MPGGDHLVSIIGIASIIAIFILIIMLVLKSERIRQFQIATDNLKKSLDEMDLQAKLIVRTDIELNKTQESLDKKVTGLTALQKLSRKISISLEENQIFRAIESANIEELGFEKACGFLWNAREKNFASYLNIGYQKDETDLIMSFVDSKKEYFLNLIQQKKTVSSRPLDEKPLKDEELLKNEIKNKFNILFFIISPILLKEGNNGFFFLGTENTDVAINEGDEELVTILANQIGQSLENARLFEKTWKSQQELEKKVEVRTQELQLALSEIKEVSKRKTDFISAVSHELRTPLTSIKGYASILLTGKLGQIPEDARLRIEKINRHSDELAHLVNDLLDISRIESGRVTMKQDELDLNNIVAEISDLLSVQLKEKQIEFSSNIEKDSSLIKADATQIKRVFINIIGNAIKFTPEKGKITVSGRKIDGQAQVDITDDGCGIPNEAKERIFEEFYRVENQINEQVKGTGLGLALVKHIIEAHNGRIWVTSEAGSGSTFSFTLPQQG